SNQKCLHSPQLSLVAVVLRGAGITNSQLFVRQTASDQTKARLAEGRLCWSVHASLNPRARIRRKSLAIVLRPGVDGSVISYRVKLLLLRQDHTALWFGQPAGRGRHHP